MWNDLDSFGIGSNQTVSASAWHHPSGNGHMWVATDIGLFQTEWRRRSRWCFLVKPGTFNGCRTTWLWWPLKATV